MVDFLQTSLSGLRAFKSALATTGHNIANVNTVGYSRQRVDLTALPAQPGTFPIGQGVDVGGIRRVLDQIQVDQLRGNIAEQNRLATFTRLSSQVNGLLASVDSGVSQPLEEFFSALQTVADSPSSTSARQLALSQANSLVDRIQTLDRRIESLGSEVDARLATSVDNVNQLAKSLAKLNTAIAEMDSRTGFPPNDLLDQRDLVLRELSEMISVELVTQDDGSVNAFVGNGQALVLGFEANSLVLQASEFQGGAKTLALTTRAATTPIGNNLGGGEIGGLLDFRREVLDPSRNTLGQLTIALSVTFNAQHAKGMDLQGNLGQDFFAVANPAVLPSRLNTGAGTITATVADIGALTTSDYLLAYDGVAYTLTRTDSGATLPMTGSGTVADPFVVDGLEIVVGAAPGAGDEFLIRPTHHAADSFATNLTNPDHIAAALPIRGTALLANAGDANLSGEEVVDASNPNLLASVTIEFIDSSTYTVNGAGSFAYTDGGPIEINGWRARIEGTPAAGDQFVVSSNAGGVGDNRNALAFADAFAEGVLDNGSTNVREGYNNLVSMLSTVTRRAEINLSAQTAITDQAIADQLSVSGVNLDEEAANMLRFQQAYQAAAQLVGVADTLFQTMLGMLRR